MTLEDTIAILINAGFVVDARYPFVTVSLKRGVCINEVWIALDYADLDYRQYGDSVLIRF